MGLTLERKLYEEIVIWKNDGTEVAIIRLTSADDGRAKFSIDAPSHIKVDRYEIYKSKTMGIKKC